MNLDDPKLTAYALGELEEPERSELEEMLRGDPAALEAIASLRSFTAKLRAELQQEKMPGLTADQRAEVLAAAREAAGAGAPAARSGEEPPSRRPNPWRFWIPAALAAGFAVATTIGLHRPDDEEAISTTRVSQVRNSPVPHAATVRLASTTSPAPRPDAVLSALPSGTSPDGTNRWAFDTKGLADEDERRLLRDNAPAAQSAPAPAADAAKPADAGAMMPFGAAPRPAVPAKREGKMLALEQDAEPAAAPAPAPAPPSEPRKYRHSDPIAAADPAGLADQPVIASAEVPAAPAASTAPSTEMETDGFLSAPAGSLAKKTAPQNPAPINQFARQPEAKSRAEGLARPETNAVAKAEPPDSSSTQARFLAPLPQSAAEAAVRQQAGPALPAASAIGGRAILERRAGGSAPAGNATSDGLVEDQRPGAALAILGYTAPQKDAVKELAKLSSTAGARPAGAGTVDTTTLDAESVQNDALGLNYRGATPPPGSFAFNGGVSFTANSRSAGENPFIPVRAHAVETFPIQLSATSYANLRGALAANRRPPESEVRLGELINEFSYQDAPAPGNDPVTVALEVASCPWASGHRLLRVELRGRETAPGQHLPVNLVLMVENPRKPAPAGNLPLLKESLREFFGELGPNDFVGIAANSTKPAAEAAPTNRSNAPATAAAPAAPIASIAPDVAFLESTNDKARVLSALDSLQPAAADAPGAASDQLQSAYALADRHYIRGGTNAILSTDDYAVESKLPQDTLGRSVMPAESSDLALRVIHLTLSPFEAAASTGVGSPRAHSWSSFWDESFAATPSEGLWNAYYSAPPLSNAPPPQALAAQLSQSLVIVAREVKLEVEFNPAEVGSYRLIGAETQPAAETKTPPPQNRETPQAGDLGSGQTITALYELAPPSPIAPRPPPTILAAKATSRQKDAALNKTDDDAGKTVTPEKLGASGGKRATPLAQPAALAPQTPPAKLLTVRLHWKAPESVPPAEPETREYPLTDSGKPWTEASEDFRWSAAVTSFGLLLRDSPYKGGATWQGTLQLATGAKGPDAGGQRQEFIGLVEKAKATLGGK